jgi:general L-amino acid transport system substrate-binding protein
MSFEIKSKIVTTIHCLLGLVFISVSANATESTMQRLKDRGYLICGVSEGLPGFSVQEDKKRWTGFDIDFCRAISAALFGTGDKVEFVPLSATERFEALKSGKIDLLSRNTTWTLERDIVFGFDFAGVIYYDGQGFMTRAENGLSSALQLAAARICILKGTTSAENARRYFQQNEIPVEIMEFEERSDALAAYSSRKCDVYSADQSALAAERTQLEDRDTHVLLPEVISKEPLGPLVRKGDDAWTGLVRWVLFLIINAEESEWTAQKAATASEAAPIAVMDEASQTLGLPPDWPRNVIRAVGHYGEIFDRNVGKNSLLELGRGVNALWTNGGILYAPPMR